MSEQKAEDLDRSDQPSLLHLKGIRKWVRRTQGYPIEIGTYTGESAKATRSRVKCPLCGNDLAEIQSPNAARVAYAFGEETERGRDVLVQPVPPTHSVYGCGRCQVGFTSIRDDSSDLCDELQK